MTKDIKKLEAKIIELDEKIIELKVIAYNRGYILAELLKLLENYYPGSKKSIAAELKTLQLNIL